jgi:drug/metabolite transporter (DMT)-like permease
MFGPLLIITAALLWSADGVLRIGLYSLSPIVIVFYEHLLGVLILFPFIQGIGTELRAMKKSQWIAIVLVSLFSGALGTMLYTAALSQVQYTQYSVVVLLQQQLQPIWAIAAAAILLRERVTKRFLFWAGIALIGAYFITFKHLTVNLETGSGTLTAGLYALGAGMLWGTSTAISKYVLNTLSPTVTTFLRFLFAPMWAFLILVGTKQTALLGVVSLSQWGMLIGITVSTGLVAMLLYYHGLKMTPARVTTLCELVWPASAVLIDYFLYHRVFSVTQGVGILIVAFSLNRIFHETRTEYTAVTH